MRTKTGPATSVLRPILDMYKDSPVAVVGCRSRGMERDSCEWDVVVVTNERGHPASVRMGGVPLDLVFVSESDALSPLNPEYSLSLASARPVRDSSLILSTSLAANSAMVRGSSEKAASTRLASSLKTLGRAEDALTRESTREADFWLLASSYEFAYAWLLSKETMPSPSHLLNQLKGIAKGSPRYFGAFSKGAGLERATRAGCGSRLDGLAVLHDVVQGAPHRRGKGSSSWSKTRLDTVKDKAQDLATRIELAECYSYMGQEFVDYIMALTTRGSESGSTLPDLFSGGEPLLSDRLLRGLGLSRTVQTLRPSLDSLRDQVSALARVI